MKKFSFLTLVIFTALALFSAVSGDGDFHSEFGWLPPEITPDSGLLGKELSEVFARIDQEGLPPSHRQRRVYEWIMQTVTYDPNAKFDPANQEDPEAVSVCLSNALKSSETGDTGFALLAHYLMKKLDIPGVIISGELTLADGTVVPHQWNYVFFSGKWYHFDPLAEMLRPELNGFMNVTKDLSGSALSWDGSALPPSADYPVRALGCDCDF